MRRIVCSWQATPVCWRCRMAKSSTSSPASTSCSTGTRCASIRHKTPKNARKRKANRRDNALWCDVPLGTVRRGASCHNLQALYVNKLLHQLLIASAVCGDIEPPRFFARDDDADFQPLLRQARRHLVRPFDQTNAIPLEVFMNAEIRELRFAGKPICIKVVDRQACVVLLNQHKRRAVDDVGMGDAQSLGDGARQVRFTGTERTDQRDHRAGKKMRSETAAEGLGFRKGADRDGNGWHDKAP